MPTHIHSPTGASPCKFTELPEETAPYKNPRTLSAVGELSIETVRIPQHECVALRVRPAVPTGGRTCVQAFEKDWPVSQRQV